jgi:hypothetical protein
VTEEGPGQPGAGLEVRVHVAAESASALQSWIDRQAGQPMSLVVVIGSQESAPDGPAAYTAEQAAAKISDNCKASWLKAQARLGKIPCVKIGGAYHFTDEHLAEVIRVFTEGPPPPTPPAPSRAAPATSPASTPGIAPIVPRPMRQRSAAPPEAISDAENPNFVLLEDRKPRGPRGKRRDS